MPTERVMPEMMATLSVPGASEWLGLSDDLLAGLVHALNNRVTALSVCAELAGFGDAQVLSDGVLLAEVARLQRTSALLAQLPARGHPEALEIAPVLLDAIAIHSHHPRMRATECTLVPHGELQPVRVPRWALLRLLLLVVDATKAGAIGSGRGASLHLSSDERDVRMRAAAPGVEGGYASEMASLCGGTLARDGEDVVLTLPSLSEVRRREQPGA
jgi:hypothetical protein